MQSKAAKAADDAPAMRAMKAKAAKAADDAPTTKATKAKAAAMNASKAMKAKVAKAAEDAPVKSSFTFTHTPRGTSHTARNKGASTPVMPPSEDYVEEDYARRSWEERGAREGHESHGGQGCASGEGDESHEGVSMPMMRQQ